MTRHIAQKIATAFVTIFVIITISFFLVHIMPGDPVIHLVGHIFSKLFVNFAAESSTASLKISIYWSSPVFI